jgi:hypothetical protein
MTSQFRETYTALSEEAAFRSRSTMLTESIQTLSVAMGIPNMKTR